MPFSAQSRDAFLGSEQRFGRGAAQRADGFGPDGLKLAVEELAADFHLVGLRRAVLGRAALHDVADVDVGALERDAFLARGALDHLREQLAGAADEREALLVLIGARAFADEHQLGLLVAGSEDDLVAAFVQAAALAIADVLENFEQRIAGRFESRRATGASRIGGGFDAAAGCGFASAHALPGGGYRVLTPRSW